MAKWHYMKGYQFYMLKKWDESVFEFLQALELYPKYFIVKYRLAYAYLQIAGSYMQYTKDTFWKALGQLNECHKIYKESSKDFQEKERHTYFDICFLHGKTIQEMNGKQEESISLLKTALSLKQDEDCQYQLAKTYFIMKDYNKSFEALPRSDKYYVKELKANIFSELGQIKESNLILFKLLKFRKKDYLYCKLADNFAKENKIEDAIKYAYNAIKFGKDNYKNYLFLGNLLFKNKKYKSAIDALKTANNLRMKKYSLSCPEANETISNILKITGDNPYDENIEKREGIITDFNLQKGFGFIFDKEYGKVFVHISNVKNIKSKDLKDKKVFYNIKKSNKGYSALDVYIK